MVEIDRLGGMYRAPRTWSNRAALHHSRQVQPLPISLSSSRIMPLGIIAHGGSGLSLLSTSPLIRQTPSPPRLSTPETSLMGMEAPFAKLTGVARIPYLDHSRHPSQPILRIIRPSVRRSHAALIECANQTCDSMQPKRRTKVIS